VPASRHLCQPSEHRTCLEAWRSFYSTFVFIRLEQKRWKFKITGTPTKTS
jgi:hypothetical protein